MPKGMGYGAGNTHGAKIDKMKVPMKQVGNVKGGKYSAVADGKPLSAYNGTYTERGNIKGSHRKTFSVGTVKGSHRKG